MMPGQSVKYLSCSTTTSNDNKFKFDKYSLKSNFDYFELKKCKRRSVDLETTKNNTLITMNINIEYSNRSIYLWPRFYYLPNI